MGIVTSRRKSSPPPVIRVKALQVDSVTETRHRHSVAVCTSPPPTGTTKLKQSISATGTERVLPDEGFQVVFFHFYEERVSLTSLDKCLVSTSLNHGERPKQIQWTVKPEEREPLSFSVTRQTAVGDSPYRVTRQKKASTVEVTMDNRGGVRRAKMNVTFKGDNKQKGMVKCKLVLQAEVSKEDAEQGWILTGKMYQDSGRSWQAFIAKARLSMDKTSDRKSASLKLPLTQGRTLRRVSAS